MKAKYIIWILCLTLIACEEVIETEEPGFGLLEQLKSRYRVDSIHYDSLLLVGTNQKDSTSYTESYKYVNGELARIYNYQEIFELRYNHDINGMIGIDYVLPDEQRMTRRRYFTYDSAGSIIESNDYCIDEEGNQEYCQLTSYIYNSNGQVVEIQSSTYPNFDRIYRREHDWVDENIISTRFYDSNNRLTITHNIEYDTFPNFKCFGINKFNGLLTRNNILHLDVVDHIGNNDGLQETINQIEYNEDGLPIRIQSTNFATFLLIRIHKEIYYN